MPRDNRTDSGVYNRPAQIQAPAARVDDGQGGNSADGQWITVCSPYVHLYSANFGRGSTRPYFAGQLYPTAKHFAEMRWRNDTAIDGTMTLLLDGRRFQILDAIDMDMEHIKILMPLIEYQSEGTEKVS
jgi:hypothetical protein